LIPCLKPAVKQKGCGLAPAPSIHNGPAEAGPCRKKSCIWESEYIQGPQERLAEFLPHSHNLFAVHQIIFLSIRMSKSGLLLAVCVKPCFPGKRWWA